MMLVIVVCSDLGHRSLTRIAVIRRVFLSSLVPVHCHVCHRREPGPRSKHERYAGAPGGWEGHAWHRRVRAQRTRCCSDGRQAVSFSADHLRAGTRCYRVVPSAQWVLLSSVAHLAHASAQRTGTTVLYATMPRYHCVAMSDLMCAIRCGWVCSTLLPAAASNTCFSLAVHAVRGSPLSRAGGSSIADDLRRSKSQSALGAVSMSSPASSPLGFMRREGSSEVMTVRQGDSSRPATGMKTLIGV